MTDKPRVALAVILLLALLFLATGCCVARKVSNTVKAADNWVKEHAW